MTTVDQGDTGRDESFGASGPAPHPSAEGSSPPARRWPRLPARGADVALLPYQVTLGAFVLTFWCVDIVSPALPEIGTSLDLSDTTTGLVVSAFFTGRLITNLPAALLVDRVGARVVAAGGGLALGAGSVLAALAASTFPLLLARGLQGIGVALVVSAALLSLLRVRPGEGAALTAFNVAAGIGSALGLATGGFLTNQFGWRAVFWLCGVLGAALVAGALSNRPARAGTPAAAGVTGGADGWAADPSTESPGDESDRTTGAAVARTADPPAGESDGIAGVPGAPAGSLAPLAGAANAPAEEIEAAQDAAATIRTPVAAAPTGMAWRAMAIPLVANLLVYANYAIFVVAVPLRAAGRFDASAQAIGTVLLVMNFAHLGGAIPAGRFVRRHGAARMIPLSLGLVALSTLVAPFMPGLTWFLIPLVVYAVAEVTANTSAGDSVLRAGGQGGKAIGALRLSSDIGLVTGPAAVGIIADLAGTAAPFIAMGTLSATVALLLWRTGWKPAAVVT
ncbi:MAG: MFS transporter [Thermomicrobiales bacterium]